MNERESSQRYSLVSRKHHPEISTLEIIVMIIHQHPRVQLLLLLFCENHFHCNPKLNSNQNGEASVLSAIVLEELSWITWPPKHCVPTPNRK